MIKITEYDLDFIATFLMICESICSLMMIIINCIYLRTFWKLKTYNASFRQTFIGVNLILGASSIFHPLSEVLDYFTKNGNFPKYYFHLMAVKYFSFYVDHVGVVFLHFKFFIFAFERWYAINKKGRGSDSKNVAMAILIGLCTFISIEVVIKTWLFVTFDTADSYELRLEKGLAVGRSAVFVGGSYIVFGFSLTVGVLLLKYTKGYIKKLRLQSQSLAESFELSQANRIADALKPMIILYIVCAVLIAPGGVFCFYLLFIEDTPYSNKLYFVGMRLNYFGLSLYTLLSLISAMYKFGMLTKRVTDFTPSVIQMAEEQDGHFSYLTDSWKMAEAKGQKSRVTSPTAKYFVQ